MKFSMSSLIITADVEYPVLFHSPGLEPWILGLLLEFKPRTMLDVGCGYGFWGFIVKRRLFLITLIML